MSTTGDGTHASNDRRSHRLARWSIPSVILLAGLVFLLWHIYRSSVPDQRWSNVGAAATAVAAVVAASGLFFVAAQSRDSAAAARAAAGQASLAASSLELAQRQFLDELDSGRRQQAVSVFESLTLGQALVARGRLAEALKKARPTQAVPLRTSDLAPEVRDDLFEVMRRFQLAEVLCIPRSDSQETYVDQELAFQLLGWDIAWWSGALGRAFGDSLARSGLEGPWESLDQLYKWVAQKDRSLSKVRAMASQWVMAAESPSAESGFITR